MVEINPKGKFVDSEKFHVAAYGRSAYQAWLRREGCALVLTTTEWQ